MSLHQLSFCFNSQSIAYELVLQAGLLSSSQLMRYLEPLPKRIAILTDSHVGPLYAHCLADQLADSGKEVRVFSFPAGESHKTRATKDQLEDQLLAQNFGRDTCIIALGGGVVTDLSGFLASTYCRGVPLLLFPTSLLAMVDACIGGKTGVNTPFGKNMIGSFYHPQAILIDPLTLTTLPEEQLRSGFMEMIKHGLIADLHYIEFLEIHQNALLDRDVDLLTNAIITSCHIKQLIVQEDERERGRRFLLNVGHTVAHALEAATHYQISHGKAVAFGILAESYMAMVLGYLHSAEFERIERLIHSYQPDLQLPESISIQALLERMTIDKKAKGKKPHFSLLKKIGSSNHSDHLCVPVDETALLTSLQWMCDVMCCT